MDARREVDGHTVKVVGGEDDAAAAGLRDQIVEAGAPLEIDVLRAKRQRVGEDTLALVFRPGERPALPRRPARDDHRQPAARERRGRGRVANRVEPHLDQIGVGDGVALLAQFAGRFARHGDAQHRLGHDSVSVVSELSAK